MPTTITMDFSEYEEMKKKIEERDKTIEELNSKLRILENFKFNFIYPLMKVLMPGNDMLSDVLIYEKMQPKISELLKDVKCSNDYDINIDKTIIRWTLAIDNNDLMEME